MALISNGDQVLTKRVYNSDETVLWEGEASSCTLSESRKNFEYLLIVYKQNDNNVETKILYNTSVDDPWLSLESQTLYNNQLIWKAGRYKLTDTTITNYTAYEVVIKSAGITVTNSNKLNILKVIGVNRKSTEEGN